MLPLLEAAAAKFERASTLQQLFHSAAVEFRLLCGYDRVMIYRFLDDDAGVVVAEDAAVGQHSFLHHHFPATDIPRQARALYVRNLVRAIPDVAYVPAPLVPDWGEAEPLDMSDSILHSVSPVHLQYLKNMGVAASASISILKDGAPGASSPATTARRFRYPPTSAAHAAHSPVGCRGRSMHVRSGAYRERVRTSRTTS
jgi:light-regulated signal transduction histidine kinase (bacteriophytochrome)